MGLENKCPFHPIKGGSREVPLRGGGGEEETLLLLILLLPLPWAITISISPDKWCCQLGDRYGN